MDNELLLIRKCSLWSDLSEEEYNKLDVQDNFKEFKKGEYIHFEAHNHNTNYFIKKDMCCSGKLTIQARL